METQGLLDATTAVVGSAPPISLASHAVIEKHYESTYRILEKALENQYMIRKKNFDDVVAGLEALISSQSEELLNYKRQTRDMDSHIRDLLYEIGELRKCISKMTKATGNEGNERQMSYGSHSNSDSGGNINTLTKPGMLLETKSDLRLGLPLRSKVGAGGMIREIDNLIDGFGSRPRTSYNLTDVEKRVSSPSSVGASSRERRSSTMSPRLGPIDECGDGSIESKVEMPFRGPSSSRMAYIKPTRPSSLGASLGGLENIHPLHRRRSLSRASSSDYPSREGRTPPVSLTVTPVSPMFARKEGPIKDPKARQHAPEPLEPDSVIRARIRMEAEKRKAASFGPGDRIKKPDIVHSVISSPARLPESQLVLKTDVLAEGGSEKPELELKRITSDGSKKTGVGLRHVVRKLRSDIWGKGSASKQSGSPVSAADE